LAISTNTTLWLDASDEDTLWADVGRTMPATSNPNVYAWDDKSGNNLHFLSINVHVRNEPQTGSHKIGSLNALYFDATKDGVLGRQGWSSLFTSGDFSVFMVAQIYSDGWPLMNWQGALQLYRVSGYNGPSVFGFNYNWDASATLPKSYYNKFTDGTQVLANTAYTTKFLSDSGIGRWTVLTHNNILYSNDAVIGEIICIDGVVSTTEREKIEGYLAHKWGLATNLPSNHPYKTSAPPV
jgi:hypothetical protein